MSAVLYLATASGQAARDAMTAGHIGLINTPASRYLNHGVTWAADNGCFADKFDEEKWWAWLEAQAVHAHTCLFAVAPDVVGDAAATLERSAPWLSGIRSLGYPAAFVLQDGQENLPVPWDDFDAAFIGGSTEWKLGPHARALVAEAKSRGKWLHMGRVNSDRRYQYARHIGCDSADGTYLAFGPDINLPKLLTWGAQGDLFGGAA